MFISLSGLGLENLPLGEISISEITAGDFATLVESVPDPVGLFDFGAVPDLRRERRFHDICAAIRTVTGICLSAGMFSGASRGLRHPIPPSLLRIAPGSPMIVVSYGLKQRKESQGSLLEGWVVDPESLSFRLIAVSVPSGAPPAGA